MTVNIDTFSVFRPRQPIVGPEYNHHLALTPPDRVTITQFLCYTFCLPVRLKHKTQPYTLYSRGGRLHGVCRYNNSKYI